MTEPVIVSDASPLHYLVLIDAAPLLRRIANEVLIPPAVVRELSHESTPAAVRRWIAHPPSWLKIVEEYLPRLKATTFRFHERLISGIRERLARR